MLPLFGQAGGHHTTVRAGGMTQHCSGSGRYTLFGQREVNTVRVAGLHILFG